MAIQKSKTLSNGSTGNYWKITKESYDKLTLKCIWEISLFSDKDHADDGAPSLGFKKMFKSSATKDQLSGDRTAFAYAFIKAQSDSDLNGGTDV